MKRTIFCLLFFFVAGAFGQQYPSKPVRMIIGFPPGGPSDIFGRAFAQAMSANLGQPVIVENKAGVGGVLGINSVVAAARKNPGRINYGSAGAGGITHLAGELLKAEARIDIVHVPYKGAAPAVSDLLGGQVQMGIFDVPIVMPHVRSGKLKALAVTTAQRVPTLPEVPTAAEVGYPKVNSDNWYGLDAPTGTPADLIKRIHGAADAALRSASLGEQFAKVGGIPFPSTPEHS